MYPSRKSTAHQRKCSKKIPFCVFHETQLNHTENSLIHFQTVCSLKLYSISAEICWEVSKLCLCDIQVNLTEIILRQMQIVSQPKFICI